MTQDPTSVTSADSTASSACRADILCTDHQFLPWLRLLPETFCSGRGETLCDRRNQVKRFEVGDTVVIVKRFRRPKGLQRLAYSTFWPDKAVKAYRYALRLLELGIDTPRPIGAVTLRGRFGGVVQYYLATEENRWPDCSCLREDPDFPDREALTDALAAYLVTLHGKGFLHGDTNLSNFLYRREADGTYRFAVIDINRSRFTSGEPTRRQCLDNLFRLTHVRPLLTALVSAYARHRQWDESACVAHVLHCLDRFERKKAFLRKLKGL